MKTRPKATQSVSDWWPCSIRQIEWDQAEVIGYGSSAVVFAVSSGVVVKVAYRIQEEEVRRQQYFAERREAVVPLDFQCKVCVPDEIVWWCCYRHGLPNKGSRCICGQPVSVLLMPRAVPLITDWDDPQLSAPDYHPSPEVCAFIRSIERRCLKTFGVRWDCAERNVARFAGRLIALDFGEV